MKSFLAASVIAVASATQITDEVMTLFKNFQVRFGKTYTDNEEWAIRLGVFAENVARMEGLNKDHMLLDGKSVHGITKFMDLSPEEFKAQYLTYRPSNTTQRVPVKINGDLATSVDWRKKGAVTEVKDQGQCGSCWAFSATEAVESYAFLSNQYNLTKLSAQQITSCDTRDGGCNGGNTETAYAYIQHAGGLTTEDAYPYTSGAAGKDGKCNKEAPAVKITGFTSVEKGEDNLMKALNTGPVSICVAAESFQTYSGGILRSCPGSVDHCVQAVGYESTGLNKHWLVRNSWNTNWGEDGYIRVAMGKDLCKISDDVTYPTF